MWFGLVGSGLVFWLGGGHLSCLEISADRKGGGGPAEQPRGRTVRGEVGGRGERGEGGKQKRKKDGCWFRGREGRGGDGRGVCVLYEGFFLGTHPNESNSCRLGLLWME